MEPQSKMVASEQPAETEETKPPHLVPINGKDRPPKEKMELTSRVAITVLPHLLLVVLACCTFYVICNTEKPKKFSIFICGSIDNNRFISHKSAGRYRLLRYKSMVKLLSTAAFRQYLRYLSIVNLVDFLVLSRYLIIIDF